MNKIKTISNQSACVYVRIHAFFVVYAATSPSHSSCVHSFSCFHSFMTSLSLSLHVQSCALTSFNEWINSENKHRNATLLVYFESIKHFSHNRRFSQFQILYYGGIREGNRLLKRCDSRQRTTENTHTHTIAMWSVWLYSHWQISVQYLFNTIHDIFTNGRNNICIQIYTNSLNFFWFNKRQIISIEIIIDTLFSKWNLLAKTWNRQLNDGYNCHLMVWLCVSSFNHRGAFLYSSLKIR